ncbi:MAG TPA: hypothetical protein VE078_18245 [Thermoanaerobaculia bacterium]|nr:hypothetical protein [Thermoanaerobaculia bacterium]
MTSGFPPDPTWDAWVEGTRQGWRYELASLKHYLERYRGRDREVVYLRRRTPTARGEAWARIMGPDGLGSRLPRGTPFIEEPPLQYAAIVDDPEGGLLRISTEPCFGRDDVRDVTLWLAAYGADGRRMEDLRREWSGLLERLYPEGESV